MSEKKWKIFNGEDCPECGSPPEVFTAENDGLVSEADEIRCSECHLLAWAVVDDDGLAWINWVEEDKNE